MSISRFGYVYQMKRKSETFEKFKEFKAEIEDQLGKSIKTIRFDRGGKYLLGDFKDFLTKKGIISQLTHLEQHNKMVLQKEGIELF